MTHQHNDSILDHADHKTGMTVPDGFFEQFAARMKDSLPEQPWETEASDDRQAGPRSLWQRVRPYVYMAAMFAGIWLMMNISTLLGSGGDVQVSTSSTRAIPTIAELMDRGASEFSDYAIEAIDPVDLYDNLYDEGFDPVNLSYNQ
ncbi:MAG: hypothetical protein NC342_04815 [Pseudoflavonifractor sp.]|nr:hypothetical protein [Alloprevotella sp.]MCM1116839.1 hypothetical protein [Pseudoflavonifractor sp.]